MFHQYPIRFGLFADTLWVIATDAAHRALLGGRLVTIGTRSGAEAMFAVEPAIQRDNDSQIRDLMPTWLVCPEILHARGVVTDIESAPIVVEHMDGSRVSGTPRRCRPGPGWRGADARAPGPRPLRDRFPERRHWFTLVPGTRTMWARAIARCRTIPRRRSPTSPSRCLRPSAGPQRIDWSSTRGATSAATASSITRSSSA